MPEIVHETSWNAIDKIHTFGEDKWHPLSKGDLTITLTINICYWNHEYIEHLLLKVANNHSYHR